MVENLFTYNHMRFEATEILTTGWCPLNCRYCYIPKSSVMKELHQQIIERLKKGTFIDALKRIYGQDLTNLGFWGTEPALTLDIIQPWLPKLFQTFPKLKKIDFSTSMILAEPIRRFIRALSPYNVNLGVQVSIDGPAFITDQNRFKGASEKIPQNFFELVSSIQDEKTKVDFKWKATFTIENIRELNGDPSKIDEYFQFFESLNRKFDEINKNKNISLKKESYLPTLAVPGNYTSQDGKDFAQFLRNLHQKGYQSAYSSRWQSLVSGFGELGIKRRMFTCSAGQSDLGLDKNLHLCHRSFYLDEDKYVSSVLKQKNIDNWDVSHFEKGTIDMVRKNFILNLGKEAEIRRFAYVMRNYHDFWKLQIGYIKAMLIELALVGQANRKYLDDDELSTLFALFVATCLGCPMENLLNTGSLHLTPLSLLRMFGNGAFQELLKETSIKPVSQTKEPPLPESTPSTLKPSLKKKQNPRIYFFNLNVGSGIERAGNTFLGMLDEYRKRHPENVIEYKLQNPPAILIQDLIKYNPDVIIMNEYFPRLIEVCYYYKIFRKNTKIILLNHCYDTLLDFSSSGPEERNSPDRKIVINYAFSGDTIDYIINLNYHPENKPYPPNIRQKTIDMYHTLSDDIWKCKVPFSKRKKDFLYVGNLLPHKFSREFVDKFSKTNMKIDIYGKMFEKEELADYNQKILKSKNFNYLGYCPPEKIVDVYNKYRFLVVPHHGYEPFMFVLLEALKTGTIPLVVIDTRKSDREGEWITWANGLYFKHNTVNELLAKMRWYLDNKNKTNVMEGLGKESDSISKEINKRTNYEKLKERFLKIIGI